MTYTSHGHQIPGTIAEPRPVPFSIARCGGPGLCTLCSNEVIRILALKTEFEIKKDENMEFTTFVRKPFVVEAVEITKENIAEVAELVGTLREKDNGQPYIQVDRRLVPNVFRVYPGFWMTRMGDNIRCYSKRIFEEQFTQSTPDIKTWVESINREEAKAS